MQTIFPILRYHDARAAILWLTGSFGFVELFSVPETGAHVRHARLGFGTNLIMLGSVRPDDGIDTPKAVGAATQALCVYVEDVDRHYESALAAGANPTGPPEDTDFGSREYGVTDPEGHLWIFLNCLPETDES